MGFLLFYEQEQQEKRGCHENLDLDLHWDCRNRIGSNLLHGRQSTSIHYKLGYCKRSCGYSIHRFRSCDEVGAATQEISMPELWDYSERRRPGSPGKCLPELWGEHFQIGSTKAVASQSADAQAMGSGAILNIRVFQRCKFAPGMVRYTLLDR
jgi:hypothetical protein